MRTTFTVLLIGALAFAGRAADAREGTGANPTIGADGGSFDVFVNDPDVDGAWELLVQDDSTFTQLTASAALKVNPSGNDSAQVTITGILTDSTYTSITSTFGEGSSTDGNRDISGKTFYAVETWWIQDEHSADISLAPAGSPQAAVGHIDGGDLWQGPAQVLFGSKNKGRIDRVEFGIIGTGAIDFEVRVYPDFKDVRDPTDGYFKIATVRVDEESQPIKLDLRKYIGKSAAVQIWGKGAAANASGWARIVGRRKK